MRGNIIVHFHDYLDGVRQFSLFPTPIIQNGTSSVPEKNYYIIKEALHMNDISEDVRLAGQGSSEAFARLYSTVYKDMYHIALYSLRNSHDACDAVSDAVLDAFSSIKKLSDPSKFRSRIMAILSAKIKRKQKEYFAPAESIDENTSLTDDFSYDNVELSEALEKLDSDSRLLLSMSVLGGYSSGEIAEICDSRPSTVRSRLAAIKQKLRLELSAEA